MKHLLSAKDLSYDEAIMLLDTAETMAATQQHAVKKLPTLRGKTVVNMFFEDSTRTRLSFEAAAKRLSADVINFSGKGSSLSKGESLKDTAQTLQAMGADAVVVRHSASGAAHLLAYAGWINVPILNGGDGTHQHPTQTLLDAMTFRRWFDAGENEGKPAPKGKDLKGAKLIIVGDVLHSRVARSNVDLMTTLGAEVTLVAPPTLLPVGMENWPCKVMYDLDEAIATIQPDGIMMLRVRT
ncbi:aspartate carbamoyltransferase catalytic subunit, partial [Actinomyces vulturis]|uniref:aspartate carbamoyltransferase catalytic subunit n=1 Tax=Actinomyces vulturis TaxID=1857645 RepID=UPI001FE1A9D8